MPNNFGDSLALLLAPPQGFDMFRIGRFGTDLHVHHKNTCEFSAIYLESLSISPLYFSLHMIANT